MINVAIDGPAGAGKSTIAKILAKSKNLIYLDTGAMYRGIAYYCIKNNIDYSDEKAISSKLDEVTISIGYDRNQQQIFVCSENVTNFIRSNEVGMAASTVSKHKAVRLKLVAIQREIAQKTNCVLDGRDIGSYVLPNAKLKIFLTATPEVRARRRYDELVQKKLLEPDNTFQKILEDINKRDYQDSHRDFAPLVKASDAVELDTSNLTIDEVCEEIISMYDSKFPQR